MLTLFFTLFLFLAANINGEETALMVGGFNGYEGARDKAELLNNACSLPSLLVSDGTGRSGRSDNVVFITGENMILTCGGESATGEDDLSCQALDISGETWVPHSVLDTDRVKSTALVLPDYGAYILGGFKHHTSSFLPTGSREWVPGPTLIGEEEVVLYYGVCGVVLSSSEFMVVGGDEGEFVTDPSVGGKVMTYDAQTDIMEEWPSLTVDSWGHSCAKLGNKVVIAGGVSPMFTHTKTTTILDLSTRESRPAGDMLETRAFFGMANIDGIIHAFGGSGGLATDPMASLELWDDENEVWLQSNDTMPTAMYEFGWVVVNVADLCPVFSKIK